VDIVQESDLYKCEKCGSRKIEKTEKQMKPASHSSNTYNFIWKNVLIKLTQ